MSTDTHHATASTESARVDQENVAHFRGAEALYGTGDA